MPTSVLITLIICVTILAIIIIAALLNASNTKKAQNIAQQMMKDIFKEDE